MTAPKHSPLPWLDNGFGIVDANGKHVKLYGTGTVDRKERVNRRLIISVVNSHDALLAAAKMAIAEIAPMPFTEESHAIWLALQAAIATVEELAP